MISFGAKKSEVTAKLVRREPNYCLIVDFENSAPPVVWYLDLEKNPTFTLSLRGSGEDWALGITEHKADFVAVARFDNRDEAEDAFEAVQKALKRRPVCHNSSGWKWLLGIVIVVALLFVASSMFTKKSESSPIASTNANNASVAPQYGVPVSADDLLKNQ